MSSVKIRIPWKKVIIPSVGTFLIVINTSKEGKAVIRRIRPDDSDVDLFLSIRRKLIEALKDGRYKRLDGEMEFSLDLTEEEFRLWKEIEPYLWEDGEEVGGK